MKFADLSRGISNKKNVWSNQVEVKGISSMTDSLDVENNIVSLYSNCHNLIHYGKDAEIIIKELYDARLKELNDAGIIITLAKLLKYYQ